MGLRELIEVDDITRSFSYRFSLEEFLRQLRRNCRIYQYEQKPVLIGTSVCEISLTPVKEFISLRLDSFKPDILVKTVKNAEFLKE